MPRNGSPTWLSWLAPIIVLWVMTLVTVDAELSSWDVAGKLEAQGFVHSANALRAAEHVSQRNAGLSEGQVFVRAEYS